MDSVFFSEFSCSKSSPTFYDIILPPSLTNEQKSEQISTNSSNDLIKNNTDTPSAETVKNVEVTVTKTEEVQTEIKNEKKVQTFVEEVNFKDEPKNEDKQENIEGKNIIPYFTQTFVSKIGGPQYKWNGLCQPNNLEETTNNVDEKIPIQTTAIRKFADVSTNTDESYLKFRHIIKASKTHEAEKPKIFNPYYLIEQSKSKLAQTEKVKKYTLSKPEPKSKPATYTRTNPDYDIYRHIIKLNTNFLEDRHIFYLLYMLNPQQFIPGTKFIFNGLQKSPTAPKYVSNFMEWLSSF